MKTRKKRASQTRTRIVGSVHTLPGMRDAARLRRGDGIDIVEVRLDLLAKHEGKLAKLLSKVRLPILLTARHPGEGGAGKLSAARRRELLGTFLPFASLIDVELRSAGAFEDLLALARRKRVETVLSFHNFALTPGEAALGQKLREARAFGAGICKIAVQLKDTSDLARLLAIQTRAAKPLATMGMGPLGKVSRLVLPLAGSRLAYGFIDRPQVAGQWPAAVLARRLKEISS
jgi:3-dehydroquinate dehydratase-1